MGLHFYKNLKLKMFIILSVTTILFIVFGTILSYIFSYTSGCEHINIHFRNLYESLKYNFDYNNFILKNDKGENIENFVVNMFDGHIVTKVYTMKKLDNGDIVYLAYKEKDKKNNNENENLKGEKVKDDILKDAEKIYQGEETSVLNMPDLFSGKKEIRYMYPLFVSDNNIAGILGFEVDVTEVRKISDKIFIEIISIFIIIVILFSIFISVIFYKFFYRAIIKFLYNDPLTKLKNRLAYEECMNKINVKIKNSFDHDKKKIYLIVFDLNDLKYVNDTLGHLAGDDYIKSAGNIINNVFSDIGSTYRTGGDEFVTIIIDSVSDEIIDEKMNRLAEYEKEYNDEKVNYVMGISAGYDCFKVGYDMNITSVLKRADEKMYKNKKLKKLKINKNEVKK